MTPSDLGERLRDIQALMRASGGWTDEAKGPINEAADMLLAQEQRIAVLEAADYSFMEEVGWQARAIDAESRILDLRELLAMDDADFLTINGLTKRLKAADAELTRLRAVEKAAREYQHSVASGDRDFPDGLSNYDRAANALRDALREKGVEK